MFWKVSENVSVIFLESANDVVAFEAESTVLYHIYKAACFHNNAIKDYINFLKNCVKAPEFILQHFQFSLLLTISTVTDFQEPSLDIIRMSMSRMLNEQQKRNESCWLRENTRAACNIEDVIKRLINERYDW